MKRQQVLNWNEYFMSVAHLSALRSKDPNTQVGACIVNDDNVIVGIGYNGLPKGCSDDEFPWGNVGETLDTKYAFVVHAELNAILNSYSSLKDCTIYVSLFPCNECAKAIIQSGITKIIYEDDKYAATDAVKASKRMLKAANVEIEQLDQKIKVEVIK
ncbi:MAG: dCMP deaminase family protein [Erysipelothrix sp.]|nr:dCMP deaminase family protein [Erysipelothrix sp.]